MFHLYITVQHTTCTCFTSQGFGILIKNVFTLQHKNIDFMATVQDGHFYLGNEYFLLLVM